MPSVPRRRRGDYFAREPGAPQPVTVRLRRHVAFSEVDAMAVLWHGRYAGYFEQANEALGRRCGMSYAEFREAGLRAPVVQFHVDYFASVFLGEQVTIVGRMVWNEGARMDIEYEIRKEDGTLAASGYTVQMFVTDGGVPLVASPPLLERCRESWRSGEFGEGT